VSDPDILVKKLIAKLLHDRDFGWRRAYAPPDHFITCPDVTITDPEADRELWFDTGVEATRITAVLQCPHEGPVAWEWADLGEMPRLLEMLDGEL
jgi:hypothetical protein